MVEVCPKLPYHSPGSTSRADAGHCCRCTGTLRTCPKRRKFAVAKRRKSHVFRVFGVAPVADVALRARHAGVARTAGAQEVAVFVALKTQYVSQIEFGNGTVHDVA